MKASILAEVITEVYNNGHVKANGQKLEYEDFLQLVYIIKAAMVEARVLAARDRGEIPNLEDMVQRKKLPVQVDEGGRKYIMLPIDPISLPDNMGIFSVLPVSNGSAQFCSPVIRMQPGAEWLFCRDTGGAVTFVPYGRKIFLHGLPDCFKEGEVAYIANDEDSDINDAIAFDVARAAWREVFRNITIPVDKIADGNPNWEEIFKTRLSSPQIT